MKCVDRKQSLSFMEWREEALYKAAVSECRQRSEWKSSGGYEVVKSSGELWRVVEKRVPE